MTDPRHPTRDTSHPVPSARGLARALRLPHVAALGLVLLSACAEEGEGGEDFETVRAFYTDVLTDPAGTTEDRYYDLFSPDVVSIPTPPAGPGAEGMLNTIAFLGQVVPDLTWDPEEIIELEDGRFVVRGNAVGTPVGPFFGVDPATGRTFDIMSIDILTLDDGKITQVYHLEDWTSATAQLTAEE